MNRRYQRGLDKLRDRNLVAALELAANGWKVFPCRHTGPAANGGTVEALGALPPTLTAWSGRNDGGRHLYFLRPAGELTSTRLPAGVDLKKNGCCIVPPSIHPVTGQPYRWEHHPAAAPPYTLRDLLRPPPRPVQTFNGSGPTSAAGLLRTVAEAPVGERNKILFWAACRAVEKCILDDLEGDLIKAAVAAGETEVKARRTIASARRGTA